MWTDYLCPWCYVALDRSELLVSLGVAVTELPYELHPEIPAEGRRVRADGRLGPTFDRIEAECDAVGMPFRRPQRMPSTRRALETGEWVRHHQPAAFDALHRSLFAAHFADGLALDDPDVLDDLVARSGGDAAEARAAVEAGAGGPLVDASMAQAREVGVTATPAWWLDDRLLIPGIQPRDTMTRWITKMQSRARVVGDPPP